MTTQQHPSFTSRTSARALDAAPVSGSNSGVDRLEILGRKPKTEGSEPRPLEPPM
ncbi:MAG: hypothetical protein ACJ72E_00300 [Marmoricola sp.]